MESFEQHEPTLPGPPDDGEPAEARLVAAIRANVFPGLTAPRSSSSAATSEPSDAAAFHRLGRYTILRELGRGGMGIVFACYDEQLERKVAVKLLRGRYQDDVAMRRLEREGQALARLSHPNVVQIYELGEEHGQLFVAMEFVVGQTLRGWLARTGRDTDRSWRDIAAVLRQAGAGLAAAHAVGLVHRDFKPDNVMVGADGRVRVLDFGLVRHAGDSVGDSLPFDEAIETHESGPRTSGSLTRSGTLLGTPAYMAPEQLDAKPCDAASDQFSFCSVAFEALFGRRAFVGDTLVDLAKAVQAGKPAAIPADSRVPRRLGVAILRGLSVDPAQRWPDLPALLAEFDRVLDVGRRSRRIAWSFGIGALLVSAAVLVFRGDEPTAPSMCSIDASALDETWDDSRRRELQEMFEVHAQGSSTAVETIDGALTDWGARWLDSQRRVCEATHVVGTQSDALLDLRTSCLERQRRETQAIVGTLMHPDGRGIARAFELLEQLPDVRVCEDPRLHETMHPLPSEPARREQILAAYEKIGVARALDRAGQIDEAETIVEELEPLRSTDHLPLSIELRALSAERSLWRRRVDEAVPRLREVIRAAEIAGLDELSATLRTRLATHIVGQWGAAELQTAALEEAEIAVARLGRKDDPRARELSLARAAWLESRGEFEAAREGYEAIIEEARERGDIVAVARGQRLLAQLYIELGRFDDVEQLYADARASFERAWGSSSTWAGADIELGLGLLELRRGDFEAAEVHLLVARERFMPLLGLETSDVALLELAQAKLAFMRGELDDAALSFARVAEQSRDDLRRAEAWEALGVIRFYGGDAPGSLSSYRRAQPLLEATLGSAHPSLGRLHSNIGESLAASGDQRAALDAFAAALNILERALPVDHPDLALPYKGRGQVRLALGDRDAAIADLERALDLHEANPGEPIEHADVEFTLARALFDAGERVRARVLAASAEQRLVKLGHTREAAKISAWIHDHPRTHD